MLMTSDGVYKTCMLKLISKNCSLDMYFARVGCVLLPTFCKLFGTVNSFKPYFTAEINDRKGFEASMHRRVKCGHRKRS